MNPLTHPLLPILLAAFTVTAASAAAVPPDAPPTHKPRPKQLDLKPGYLNLASARVVASVPSLLPLARILADEIAAATPLKPVALCGPAKPGDIVLSPDAASKEESYSLSVGDQATVRGGSYGAVAMGTASLLQAIIVKGTAAALPHLMLVDSPDKAYRGLMVDVARQYHSIDNLKQIVELCRLYKIRFLQLHLTDDQGFMFPSTAFPKVLTQVQNGGKPYTLDELNGLVAYADARNVTIVPEFDIPGHSAALNRSDPDFWMIRGTKPYEHHASINFARDEVIDACTTIIGEMCRVFKSTPYFHIGGDEADYVFADQNAQFQAAFKKLGLGDKAQHELYRRFLTLMDAAVKKNGKHTIVWEGFGSEPNSKYPIPKDVIVMVYENRFYQPNDLEADGYTIVNASWTPLYVLRNLTEYTQKIFEWNINQFGAFTKEYDKTTWRQLEPNDKMSGTQVCSWEQPQAVELGNLRWPVAAMSERVWNQQTGKSWPQFQKRLAATDSILEKTAHTVHWQCDGFSNVEERMFATSFKLAMTADQPGNIRYTLDGKVPTEASPVFKDPLSIEQPTTVRAALFDSSGKQVGPLTEDNFRKAAK